VSVGEREEQVGDDLSADYDHHRVQQEARRAGAV
jgi:hypothetical protein